MQFINEKYIVIQIYWNIYCTSITQIWDIYINHKSRTLLYCSCSITNNTGTHICSSKYYPTLVSSIWNLQYTFSRKFYVLKSVIQVGYSFRCVRSLTRLECMLWHILLALNGCFVAFLTEVNWKTLKLIIVLTFGRVLKQ